MTWSRLNNTNGSVDRESRCLFQVGKFFFFYCIDSKGEEWQVLRPALSFNLADLLQVARQVGLLTHQVAWQETRREFFRASHFRVDGSFFLK